MNYLIKKEAIPEFLNSLSKKFEVFAPAANETGATSFQRFQGQELSLEAQTYFSPKKFFRPFKEKIFSFKKKGSSHKISPEFDKTKRIIFGIRPCDCHALKVLDELFIKYYGDDRFYSARRKNTLLIAIQCIEECKNGFCQSMGTSQATGHDIVLIPRGHDFFARAETETGKKLLNPKYFKHISDAEPSQKIKCKNSLNTKNLAQSLYKNFAHPIWKKEAERCLSCSSCTQVCPTCYCYITDDEFEFGSATQSSRFRILDSCQLTRFTKVAGNHVFRVSRASRLRQFVLHKLSYYKENHGMQLCVGCGRCISACPAKIDLTFIANKIQGGKK